MLRRLVAQRHSELLLADATLLVAGTEPDPADCLAARQAASLLLARLSPAQARALAKAAGLHPDPSPLALAERVAVARARRRLHQGCQIT